MALQLTFHEIRSLDDPLFDPWLDLYQTSFPLQEQVLVSDLNRCLRSVSREDARGSHFLVALDAEGAAAAMARYDVDDECRASLLWYLAVDPQRRSQGIGAAFYSEMLSRLSAERPPLAALLYEVEDPEVARGSEEREVCLRRIGFYRRLGGRVLTGIRYTLSVGWQEPIPMLVMAHDLSGGLEPEGALRLAQQLLGDSVVRVGQLGLE